MKRKILSKAVYKYRYIKNYALDEKLIKYVHTGYLNSCNQGASWKFNIRNYDPLIFYVTGAFK